MTVTYKTNPAFPGINFPVLHRVVYGQTTDGVAARYQNSYRDYRVREWCNANCRAPFYLHPGWTPDKFVEFEDDADATAFALKWA
jgi:hypothetical protein